MKPVLVKLDDALAKADCERKQALSVQKAQRQQARDRGIPTKVTHLVAWIGSGSYDGLSLVVDGRNSTLAYNCEVVYRQEYGHNIQVYCPGDDWEAALNKWHRELQLEVTVKETRLDGIRATTEAIEAATTCKVG